MDSLRRMAVFAAVVRHGSMSAAARQLGMSTSAVSQQVRLLEQGSGVTLLHRSTRKLSLTDAGARFAEHCRAMVEAAERAQAQLVQAHDAPSGELRMSAPVGFARHVAPALTPLLADYPALKLRLLVDDALIDLIDARIDLALRAGRLPDSNWVAQKLCQFEWVMCASPAYLRRHGTPESPADLAQHQWLLGSREGSVLQVELQGPNGEAETVRVEARIASNNQLSLEQMCEAGLGLGLMTHPDVHPALQAGRLQRVLPAWQVASGPVWAVTPQRDNQPAKVRHAIAALQAYFAAAPGTQR
ncbi:MAG TPA: LysR family transcriptional regulator [Rhizobacter sp.]|jgi:DNA-binding transcriptional LysR family regulator|nr:LysR family transcriptional regulator [Rhizobacter sp.]